MTSTARTVLRATVQLDRRGLHGTDGLRTALGVGVPLLLGLAAGRPLDGLAAAGGAFSAGYAVFATGYRARLSALLLATVAVSVSTFVGAAVGDVLWLLAVTAALWGWAAGMLVSLGVAPGLVGLQAVISLLVITQFSMPLQDGLGRAGLVLLGGLVQVALLLTVWPLRRSPAERQALAEVYRSLADYAAALPDGHAGPPDGRPLEAARLALRDPQPFLRDEQVLLFTGLHDQAERLRTTLSGLALLRRSPGAATASLDDLARAAAALLHDVATAVELPRSGLRAAALARLGPEGSPHRWVGLVAASGRMDGESSGLSGEVARLATALLVSLVQVVRVPGPGAAVSRHARVRSSAWREALPTLRAHLTLRSAVLRHALRLAATLGVGTLLSGFLPFEHRYWLPLTALVVLKPDFRSTFSRGIGRIVGTAAGAALAGTVAATLRPGPLLLTLLVVLTAWGCYAFLFANYALFGLWVTAFVVFLLSFAGLPETSTVLQRVGATVLGGALALLAYALWPTWERVRVPEQLARLLQAQGDYAARLLEEYARPPDGERSELEERRAAALMARSNAEASVERAHGEPAGRSGGLPVEDAAAVVAAVRGFALAALALQALPVVGRGAAREPLLRFAAELQAAFDELAASLREGRPPAPRPALDAAVDALRTALLEEARSGPVAARDAAVLEVESVALAHAAHTVREVLTGQPGPASSS